MNEAMNSILGVTDNCINNMVASIISIIMGDINVLQLEDDISNEELIGIFNNQQP